MKDSRVGHLIYFYKVIFGFHIYTNINHLTKISLEG